MGCNGGIVSFSHSCYKPQLSNAAGITYVGLKYRRCPFLEYLPESPLCKYALARCDRNVCLPGKFRHDINIKRLHYLFIEPRIKRLKCLYEKACGGWLHRPVKINPYIHPIAHLIAQSPEPFKHLINKLLSFNIFEWLT